MIELLRWAALLVSVVAFGALLVAWRGKWAHRIVRPVVIFSVFVAAESVAWRIWALFFFDPLKHRPWGEGLSIVTQILLAFVLIVFVAAIGRYERVKQDTHRDTR